MAILSIALPVNELGEMILTKGSGSDTYFDTIPGDTYPIDENGRVVVVTKHIVPERKKVEVYYTFTPTIILNQGVTYNLINLIKTYIPVFGQLSPFFNVTTNELNCYNEDASMHFKLNVIGNWSGGSTNRSMQVDFLGTNGNRLVQSRDSAVTSDILTFNNIFSIDKGGNIATNGTEVTIQSNGGNFTMTNILLIAEQEVITDEIL